MLGSGLAGLGPVDQNMRVLWPLVGRDGELGLAAELLSDGSPGGVVVAGAAGVGKTRLAAEVARRRSRAVARSSGCGRRDRRRRSRSGRSRRCCRRRMPVQGAARSCWRVRAQALVERAGGRPARAVRRRRPSARSTARRRSCISSWRPARRSRSSPSGAASRCRTRCGRCGRTSCARSWSSMSWLARRGRAAARGGARRPDRRAQRQRAVGADAGQRAVPARARAATGVERGVLAEDGRRSGAGAASVAAGHAAGGAGRRALGRRSHRPSAARLRSWRSARRWRSGLLEASELAALEALEAPELVERRVDGRRRFVDVAHPLHGEVVRARLAGTRLEAIQRRLADAVAGARRTAARRTCRGWRRGGSTSGGAGDPALFERAAEQALAALDFVLAERFAHAAVQAGGGFGARLALGRALAGAGRADEAERAARRARGRRPATTASARRWRSRGPATCSGGSTGPTTPTQLLQRAQARRRRRRAARRAGRASGSGWWPRSGGRCEALAAAAPLLRRRGRARAGAAARRGRRRRGAAVARSHRRGDRADRDVAAGRAPSPRRAAAAWSGAARRARVRVAVRRPAGRGDRVWRSRPTSSRSRGARRRPRRRGQLRSASSGWRGAGPDGAAVLSRERRAAARHRRGRDAGVGAGGDRPGGGAGGRARAARARRSQEMERAPLGHKGFEFELGLGAGVERRGGRRALAGTQRSPRETSRARARRAVRTPTSMRALHELSRLGDPAPRRRDWRASPAALDGPFAQIAAAHAAALVARDGRALLEVAERFADQGALLLAAEAADAAGGRAPRAGPRGERPRGGRARGASGCGHARGRARRRCSARRVRRRADARASARSRCWRPPG